MDVNEAKELLRKTILEEAKTKLKKNNGHLGKFRLSDDSNEVLYWTLFSSDYSILYITTEDRSPYLISLSYLPLNELIQITDELWNL